MPTDREILKRCQAAEVAAQKEFAADPSAEVNASHRRVFTMVKTAAEPAAADAMTNGVGNNATVIYVNPVFVPRKSKLVSVKFNTPVALTSSNTTYATINVTKDNGAGGSQTVVFSATTKNTGGGGTGSWTAGQVINADSYIVSTSDANIIAAGSLLQLQITKASTGVVVPVMSIQLDLEEV